MAKSLAERVQWHAAQKLSVGSLESRYLSTLRFTLLALNDFDYLRGADQIDAFMDDLEFEWRAVQSESEAHAAEAAELGGPFHYPLNIQNNRRPELAAFTRHLRGARKAYREQYLKAAQPRAASVPASDARRPDAFAAGAAKPSVPTTGEPLERPVLALISCTKSKAGHACSASELYQPSTWFSYAYRYATSVADKVLILSAKHGVVRPEQVIAPYEQTLVGASQAQRAAWAARIYDQLREAPEYKAARSLVWLAGQNYRGELLPRVRTDGKRSTVPMKGLAQGEQTSWLKARCEGRPAPVRAVPEELVAPAVANPVPPRTGTAPSAEDFRRALLELKTKALTDGRTRMEISAGELHRIVGGYPGGGTHRMPICCRVMRQEMGPLDAVLAEPPKGAGAGLRIAYEV